MDFPGQISKDQIRRILDNMPNTRENQTTINALSLLLTKKTIQPVPYTYSAIYSVAGAANALAAGALNQIFNIVIQADADFLVINQTYDCNTANAARNANSIVIPNISVILTDTGSGFQMMDQGVPVPSIFGNGQFPYVLPNPKLLPAKTTLQVSVTNYDAAAGYNLRLSFNGVKLYSFD